MKLPENAIDSLLDRWPLVRLATGARAARRRRSGVGKPDRGDPGRDEAQAEAGLGGYAPQITEERARLAALQGDAAATEEGLREALRGYGDIGARGHAARLVRELGL